MNRRRFLAMATGGAAAALAACGDGVVSGVPGMNGVGPIVTGGGGPPTPKVIKVDDFPELTNSGTLVMLAGTRYAVKRVGANSFAAFDATCTHAGCLTSVLNNAFVCGCHGSEFSNNGKVTVGPASSDLASVATTYNAATDMLTIG